MSDAPRIEIAHKIVLVPIDDITPYEKNPRRNSETIEKLVDLIPRVGFNVPLLLDRQNVIVKGHSRWHAGKRLGLATLPCLYTDADAAAIRLDRLTDNRVHDFTLWDEELLSSELASLNLDFDLKSLGFTLEMPSFEVISEPAPVTAQDAARAAPKRRQHEYREVTCPHCDGTVYVKK